MGPSGSKEPHVQTSRLGLRSLRDASRQHLGPNDKREQFSWPSVCGDGAVWVILGRTIPISFGEFTTHLTYMHSHSVHVLQASSGMMSVVVRFSTVVDLKVLGFRPDSSLVLQFR